MKKALLVFGCLIAFLALATFQFAFKTSDRTSKGWIQIESSTFRSVYAIHDVNERDIVLYLVFPFGEADSNFSEGLAHYVEHLAWLSAFSDENDQSSMHSNAWTNLYTTGYWLRASEHDLHGSLKKLTSVADPFDVEDEFGIEERDIVQREYDYRVAEKPLYPIFREIEKLLFQDGPLSRSLIGTPEDISNYRLDDAKQLHAESHVLSEATLIVYGNFPQRRLENVVADFESSIENQTVSRTRAELLLPIEITRDEGKVSVEGYDDELFVYHKLVTHPNCGTPERCETLAYLAERVIDSTLPGGIAGPLRYDNFLARSFSFSVSPIGTDHLQISFTATPDRNVSLDDLQAAFEGEIQKSLNAGLFDETFRRVVEREQGRLDGILEPEAYNKDLLLSALQTNTGIYDLSDERNSLSSISKQDLNNFLSALAQPGRVVIRHITPQGTD